MTIRFRIVCTDTTSLSLPDAIKVCDFLDLGTQQNERVGVVPSFSERRMIDA